MDANGYTNKTENNAIFTITNQLYQIQPKTSTLLETTTKRRLPSLVSVYEIVYEAIMELEVF